MVTLLEVMITSQVTITSQEVIVTSPINEQMVEANNLHLDLGVVNSGVSLDLVAAISWVSKFLLIKTL